MRVRHTAQGAVREKVGRGTAVSQYSYVIPVSKPAEVIRESADPETTRTMSDTKEEQGRKIVVGLLATIATWFVTGGVAMLAYDQGFRLSHDVTLSVYFVMALILLVVSIDQYKKRANSSFEQITWIVSAVAFFLMMRSLYLGTEEKTAMIILAFWAAALNPFGLAKLIAGMGGWNDANVTRSTLYVNEHTVRTDSEVLPTPAPRAAANSLEEPCLTGVRENGQLVFPAVDGAPLLVRQVEDFCYIAMQERVTGKGLGSGLAREAMLGQMIGPRNNTVASRPVSYIKVTRHVYDAIMAGLYAVGLVEDGSKGATWSKIKPGTQFTCGYSINEIRAALLAHSDQSIGKS